MSAIYTDLKGRKILLTGATRGIGRAVALELAKQGAHIIFNYRSNPEGAQEFATELKSNGASDATALEFDITDTEKMKSSIDTFTKEVAHIEGLINNAGISKDQLTLRVKPEDIDSILNVNLKGAMVLTNHLTRSFLRAKDVSIVHMSSVVGLMGNTSQTVYATSKAGIIGYSKSYAKELASKRIRSNVVCPGFIETQMTQELSKEAKNKYKESIPLGEYGTPQDVAQLVLFLLSNSSSYITGEVIKVDGGLYI